MKNKVRIFALAAVLVFVLLIAMFLTGCRESEHVSYNISKEADSFGVIRKLTVLNVRSDTIMLELTGTFALSNTSTNELAIICKTGENEYRKHYVYLNDWTAYTVEDISGADVNPYQYEITFYPQMLPVFDVEVDGLE